MASAAQASSRIAGILLLLATTTLAGASAKSADSNSTLISDMKAYHENLPAVDIFEGQTIVVKEVLCGQPPFCFYCPLAAILAKPFWILHGVVQDEAFVNKIGLKCLKALHAGFFSDLLDAYDYLSLAVLDPAAEDMDLDEIATKAHHKLKLLEHLACKPKEPPHYPPLYSPDSPVCSACAHLDSLECKYHIKKLCNEGYVHVKHGYGHKPVPDFEANFLWVKLGHKTPKVCDTLLEGYADPVEAHESHVLLAHVIVHHCEEHRTYNPCPKPTYGKMPAHKGSSYGGHSVPYGQSSGTGQYPGKPDYGYESTYHQDPYSTPAQYEPGHGHGPPKYGNPYEEPEQRYHDPPSSYDSRPAYGAPPSRYGDPYSDPYSSSTQYKQPEYGYGDAATHHGSSGPAHGTVDNPYGSPYEHQPPPTEYPHEDNGPAPSY